MSDVIKNVFTQEFYSKMMDLPVKDNEYLGVLIAEEDLASKTFDTIIEALVSNEFNISTGTHITILDSIKKEMLSGETYSKFLDRLGEEDFYKKHYYEQFKTNFVQKISIDLQFFLSFSEEYNFNKNQKNFDYCVKSAIISSVKCKLCGIHILSLLLKNKNKDKNEDDGMKCPTSPKEIQEFTINFPTGKLFCADWFRNDANTLDKHIKDVKNPELQKLKENFEYETEHGDSPLNEFFQVACAADKDVVTVFVGNSLPQIFQNNNKLSFNSYNEDTSIDEGYKDVGYVCTDLWRVTIADEQTLIEILQKKHKKTVADEILAEWKKEATIVNVEPGRYKLTFSHIKRQTNQEKNQFFTLEKIED